MSSRRAAVLAAQMACEAYAHLGALGVVRAALPSYPQMVEHMWPVAVEVVALRRAAKRGPRRKRERRLRLAEGLLARAAQHAISEVVIGLAVRGQPEAAWAPFRVEEWPLDPAGRAA